MTPSTRRLLGLLLLAVTVAWHGPGRAQATTDCPPAALPLTPERVEAGARHGPRPRFPVAHHEGRAQLLPLRHPARCPARMDVPGADGARSARGERHRRARARRAGSAGSASPRGGHDGGTRLRPARAAEGAAAPAHRRRVHRTRADGADGSGTPGRRVDRPGCATRRPRSGLQHRHDAVDRRARSQEADGLAGNAGSADRRRCSCRPRRGDRLRRRRSRRSRRRTRPAADEPPGRDVGRRRPRRSSRATRSGANAAGPPPSAPR